MLRWTERLASAVLIVGVGALVVDGLSECSSKKANWDLARAHLRVVSLKVDAFRADVGRIPEHLDELVASDAARWRGPYAAPRDLLARDRTPIGYVVRDAEHCYYGLREKAVCSWPERAACRAAGDPVLEVRRNGVEETTTVRALNSSAR